jgi:NADPH2:quinone reductase
MRVVECAELGPVAGLRIVERAAPAPAPGQVVIQVEAAGVNYVDALFVQGRYQIKPPLPFVPGSEVAGRIVAVGDGVSATRVGARVLAMCGLGGFAEMVQVPDDTAVAIPDRLGSSTAAAFTQSFCTARFALTHRAGLVAGERVLVLGGGGGVGLATIEVARAAGATVLAAAFTEQKRAAALAAGADAVVDTSGDPKDAAEHLKREARAWGGSGSGIDVALDPVGGPLAEAALRALGYRGRLVVIGFASGEIPDLPANQILLRNRSVLGVDWGAWALSHPAEQRVLLEGLLADVAAGTLRPAAPQERPLAEAATALDDLLHRRVTGKVVLVP